MQINVPIVVVAYNRPKSLARLLKSISQADYPEISIDLIISIDADNENQNVLAIANDFEWKYGEKKVNYQKVNLGLRSHILKCGDLTNEYDAIILLEDDLYVSTSFYFFAYEALEYSLDKDYIGGISLYNHQLNVHNKEHFTPLEDGFDNWYFQFASSWGQAWTTKQWAEFKEWYSKNDILKENSLIPRNVSSWSNKSWLKFYIAFLIKTNKYFLYPKISMSTNFSDAGTHRGNDSTIYQVPLYLGKKRTFNFSQISNSSGVYDAFYENVTLSKVLGYLQGELCIDLYATKEKNSERYWLTTRILDLKKVKTFSRSLRPMDANIYKKLEGTDIFLYDTEVSKLNTVMPDIHRKILYNVRYLSFADTSKLFFQHLKSKYERGLNKIFKSK